MPDVGNLLNGTSVYAGVAAILFSVWYPSIELSLGEKRPDDIRNAAPFKQKMRSALLTKSIPLLVFLGAYTVSLGGQFFEILKKCDLSLSGADPSLSLFVFLYVFLGYIAAVSIWQAVELFARWVAPTKNNTRAKPAIRNP